MERGTCKGRLNASSNNFINNCLFDFLSTVACVWSQTSDGESLSLDPQTQSQGRKRRRGGGVQPSGYRVMHNTILSIYTNIVHTIILLCNSVCAFVCSNNIYVHTKSNNMGKGTFIYKRLVAYIGSNGGISHITYVYR